jgi:asparagine synthase (glutamine-hydrolysing)
MCGICGIAFGDPSRHVAEGQLESMAHVIAHRGPDEAGLRVDGAVGLGHRRLSIVDLASGQQPMSNSDGSTWIVFNGEIYNHTDLRAPLEQRGHRYRTRSDTETIIHAYAEYGVDMPANLRGMFAFALWDTRTQTLFLARDHTGIKPLYFAHLQDGTLVFGSEIKAIFASGLIEPEIDAGVVEEYLSTGHVSGERTLYRGIQKVLPGTSLSWHRGLLERRQFWRVREVGEPDVTQKEGSAEEFAADFWERFMNSVQSQLMSDVPLGVFLSGGLDSSLLVAAMREAGVPTIRSFSVGYHESEASELPWARLVAQRLGTIHHEVLVDGADFFRDLPQLTWHRDLPLTFSASIPLYHVSRLAREHVKVVLTGEGSDELFAGYGRYPRALANLTWARRLDRTLPGPVRAQLARQARRGGSGYVGSRLARSFLAKAGTVEASCLEPFAEFSGTWTTAALQRDVPRGQPFGDLSTLIDSDVLDTNPLEALLRYDQRTYMEELLMKQDTMSMAASIESRVPFLDHLLVEWSARVPAARKLRGALGKVLVRDAGVSTLPTEVVEGPKRGFLVPLARWLRGEGLHSLREHMPETDDAILSRDGYQRLVDEHTSGLDHTGRLWRLLALQIWRNDTIPRMAQLAQQARDTYLQPVAR